jgi:hypothetical protein
MVTLLAALNQSIKTFGRKIRAMRRLDAKRNSQCGSRAKHLTIGPLCRSKVNGATKSFTTDTP